MKNPQENEQSGPDLMSLAEHARRLGVASKWVANRCAAGTWPARTVLIGRRRLVPVLEHRRMVAELLAAAGIKPPAPAQAQIPATAQGAAAAEGKRRGLGRPRQAAGVRP